MLHDDKNRFGTVTRILHWVVGVLVIWQLLKLADYINDGENWISQALVKPFHSSIGLIVAALVVVRLVWAITQRNNGPVPMHFPVAATWGHRAAYLFLFLTPFTAICLMLGKGYGLRFFGNVIVERGATESELLATIGSYHATCAIILTLIVLGHIGMVIYHHFILKDATLSRMVGK
ncbi:MAG: cytochrome b [Cellvibrio sp.]